MLVPEKSTGAAGTLDGAEMPSHGKVWLLGFTMETIFLYLNLHGNNCQVDVQCIVFVSSPNLFDVGQ